MSDSYVSFVKMKVKSSKIKKNYCYENAWFYFEIGSVFIPEYTKLNRCLQLKSLKDLLSEL